MKTQLRDMVQSDSPTITVAMAASIMNCAPQNLRITIRKNPETIGFPTYCSGNRIHIPRIPFLQWLGAA